jgi:hypothetical protein
MLSETDAFRRHPIEVGRPNFLLAETADVAITQIICQKENDVRRGIRLRVKVTSDTQKERARNEKMSRSFHRFDRLRPRSLSQV